MSTPTPGDQSQNLMDRLESLAGFSEDPEHLTRTYLSPALKAAGQQVVSWMTDAGMSTRMDAAGNIIGRYEGHSEHLPALVIGSHIDTVRNAGKFDGMYGVLAGIAVVDAIRASEKTLPFAIEVVAFADEEGARFGATLLGSHAFAGTFDTDLLSLQDADGISMSEAMLTYGLDPAAISQAGRKPSDLLAYIELHIEQGPVLIEQDLPVGIVTAIAGATRYAVTVTGQAGHAGTVPMTMRNDAASAAAEAVLLVESICSCNTDAVGTVGQLNIPNGATNVIAGCAEFTIDIRCGEDGAREEILDKLHAGIRAIEERRAVTITLNKTHEAASATCSPALIQQLKSSIAALDIDPVTLLSGAGHDAMALTNLTQIAMLFVRCGNGGISHHPDETMTASDAQCGVDVLLNFVQKFEAPITSKQV